MKGAIYELLKPEILKGKHPNRCSPVRASASFWAFLGYWSSSPLPYRYLASGLLFFAIFNSSDVFLGGLMLFVVVYAGMACIREWKAFWVLFMLYGLYAAATEGIAKA